MLYSWGIFRFLFLYCTIFSVVFRLIGITHFFEICIVNRQLDVAFQVRTDIKKLKTTAVDSRNEREMPSSEVPNAYSSYAPPDDIIKVISRSLWLLLK